MGTTVIKIKSLGKSYSIAPANIGRKWRKRRVLTEDLSRFISGKNPQNDLFTFWALRDISFEVQKGEVSQTGAWSVLPPKSDMNPSMR